MFFKFKKEVLMKKSQVIVLIMSVVILSACSNLKMNENFSADAWNKILIIPVIGESEFLDSFESKFVYELGSDSNFQIIDPELVKTLYKEIFPNTDPNDIALSEALKFAEKVDASAIIYGKVKFSQSLYSVNLYSTIKLVDVKTKQTVAISRQEDDSMFFLNERNLFSSIATEAATDIKEALSNFSSM
jgi:hypothetical protein